MYIKSLTMKGFKGKKEVFPINFEQRITGIIGDNGKGKSTIGDGIRWLLCGCDAGGSERNNGFLLNQGEKEMAVTAEIDLNGKEIKAARSYDGVATMLTINGKKEKTVYFEEYYGSKDILMAFLDMNYVLEMEPSEARSFFMKLLPAVPVEEVVKEMNNAVDLLRDNLSDIEKTQKGLREKLKKLENEEANLKGRITALMANIKEVPELKVFATEKEAELGALEKRLKGIQASLEKSKELTLLLNNLKDKLAIQSEKRVELLAEHKEMKKRETALMAQTCPTCQQKLTNTEKLLAPVKAEINQKVVDGKAVAANIKVVEEEIAKVTKALEGIQNLNHSSEILGKMDVLKKEKQTIDLHNNTRNNVLESNKKLRKDIDTYEKGLDEVIKTKAQTEKHIAALKEYSIKQSEMQVKKLSEYLSKVSVKLFKPNKETGELDNCFILMYEGKNKRLLSTSEKIKAGIEIANMINTVTGLNLPLFLDNGECITKAPLPKDTQVILTRVEAGKELQVMEKKQRAA